MRKRQESDLGATHPAGTEKPENALSTGVFRLIQKAVYVVRLKLTLGRHYNMPHKWGGEEKEETLRVRHARIPRPHAHDLPWRHHAPVPTPRRGTEQYSESSDRHNWTIQ